MKSWRKVFLGLAIVVSLVAIFSATSLFAADAAPATGIDWGVFGERVVVIAGIVFAVLQGIKKLLPAISGWPARVVSIVLVIAGAYAAAAPDQVLSLQFAFEVLLAFLGATGLHDALRRAPGK